MRREGARGQCATARRGEVLSGGGRRGGVLVLLLASAMALQGCGAASAPLEARAAGDVERRLVELHYRISGSPEDRTTGAREVYVRLQEPLRDCMAAHGYSYTPPPFHDPYAGWSPTRDLSAHDILAPVDDVRVGRDAFFLATTTAAAVEEIRSSEAAQNPGYTNLPPAEQEMYAKQLDDCAPAPENYEDAAKPSGTDEAYLSLDGFLRSVERSSAVQQQLRGYATCLQSAGFSAQSRSELVDSVRLRFLDPASGGLLAPDAPGWQDAVKVEQAAAAADATCRRPAHDAALAVLATRVAEYEREHGQELRALDAARAARRARADRLRTAVEALQSPRAESSNS